MNILYYFVGFCLFAPISSFGLSTILIILRVGFPICNDIIDDNDEYYDSAKIVKSKYSISLIVWTLFLIVITLLCRLNKPIFIGYIWGIILNLFKIIPQSGQTETNMTETLLHIKNNKKE